MLPYREKIDCSDCEKHLNTIKKLTNKINSINSERKKKFKKFVSEYAPLILAISLFIVFLVSLGLLINHAAKEAEKPKINFVNLIDGSKGVFIECSGVNNAECVLYNVGNVCPNGYTILDRNDEESWMLVSCDKNNEDLARQYKGQFKLHKFD